MSNWMPGGRGGWCSVRTTPARFEFAVNARASQCFDNFTEALDLNASLLYQDWNDRPLFLALSGGIDSEVVADTFVRNRIPFTPLIFEIGTVNQGEAWYAHHWCYRNKVTPKIHSVDLEEYEKIYRRYLAQLRNTKLPGIIAYLYLADYIQNQGGYYVCGLGDINQDQTRFYTDSVDFSIDIWRPGQHPSGFFMYTAEMAASYIKKFDSSLDEQYNKLNFYNVPARPKIEWTSMVHEQAPNIGKLSVKWNQLVPDIEPHWFGTKQQTLETLFQ